MGLVLVGGRSAHSNKETLHPVLYKSHIWNSANIAPSLPCGALGALRVAETGFSHPPRSSQTSRENSLETGSST